MEADQGGDVEGGPQEYSAGDVSKQNFQDYIDVARGAVSLFDYDIRTTLHQRTKQRVWALVNTTSDPQTQLATTYSPDELSFIKRLLDAMFETYNTQRMEVMALTQMQAMKLSRPANRRTSTQVPMTQSRIDDDDDENNNDEARTGGAAAIDRGLKHSEVEDVLASLVDGGWLERSREKFYTLTPRGLLELRPWLVETYNDPDAEADEWQRIKFCVACKDLLTYGLRCADPSCLFRLHDTCEDAFWRVQGGGDAKACPRCQRDWTGSHYVGERAVTQTEAFQRGRRRPGATAPRQGASHAEEDDDDDDEDDDKSEDD